MGHGLYAAPFGWEELLIHSYRLRDSDIFQENGPVMWETAVQFHFVCCFLLIPFRLHVFGNSVTESAVFSSVLGIRGHTVFAGALTGDMKLANIDAGGVWQASLLSRDHFPPYELHPHGGKSL